MKIAVLGGGNDHFAAAGKFALHSHDVRPWRRDAAEVAQHRATDSRILIKDAGGRHDVQPGDIDKAIRHGFAFRYAVLGYWSSSTGVVAISSTTPAAISKARLEATATARPK